MAVNECEGNPCGTDQGCLDNLRDTLNDFVCVCTNVTKTAVGKRAVCEEDDEIIAQWLVVTLAISGVFLCLAALVFIHYTYQLKRLDALHELEARAQRVNSIEYSSGDGTGGGSDTGEP